MPRAPRTKLPVRVAMALVLALVLGAAFVLADWYRTVPEGTQATYVGRHTCAECHAPQAHHWIGSNHDLAMQPATPLTVLGNFDNAEFTHEGVTSRMYRQGEKFFVETEGPDGERAGYEVKYTFGVRPLQQYLAELRPTEAVGDAAKPEANAATEPARSAASQPAPGEAGRSAPKSVPTAASTAAAAAAAAAAVKPAAAASAGAERRDAPGRGSFSEPRLQVLPVSWDVEGKRWFHANPSEPASPGDPLHWTGWANTWNHMCAHCHSTNVHKGFDLAANEFRTTFSELNVGCESCHGPGSIHVDLARSKQLFWDRKLGYGLVKLKGTDSTAQLETCAACHSRQLETFHPGWQAGARLADHFRLALLDEPLYWPDGQIRDEVYAYGSFLQSRMYREKVRCTDCHDPHSARLLRPGNQLCTSCHMPAKYDVPAHHHHAAGSSGASCVECHMPHRKYMVVDPRRDHSLRVPRPDLSQKLGSPNACTGCHLDPNKRTQADEYAALLDAQQRGDEEARRRLAELDAWAAQHTLEWYGDTRRREPHYGEAFFAARRGMSSVARDDDLAALLGRIARDPSQYGPLVRATAVSLLPTQAASAEAWSAVERALGDADATVRAAAVAVTVETAPPTLPEGTVRGHVLAALHDPVRLVRNTAVRAIIGTPELGIFHAVGGEPLSQRDHLALVRSIEEFEHGMAYHADQAMAHGQLAMLHEARGNVPRAVECYQHAIRVQPELAGPRTSLAMHLHRAGQAEQARALLEEEAELHRRNVNIAPRSAEVHADYAMALLRLGRPDEAAAALAEAARLAPHAELFRWSLLELYEGTGRLKEALDQAEAIAQQWPDREEAHEAAKRIRRALERQSDLPE